MKRTELKRKSPLRTKTPLSRGKPVKSRKPKKAQKDVRWRSEEYIAWVKQQPCMLCAMGPCDPHHVIGLHWGLSGQGLTAPDSYAMPLCRIHHRKVHNEPALQKCQPTWLRWTIRKALEHFGCPDVREQLTHALAFIEAKEAV